MDATKAVKRPLPQPARESVREDELPPYDHIVARSRRLQMPGADGTVVDPYWAAMLNAPAAAFGLAEMGRIVRTAQLRGAYSDAQREFVDMVMSVDFGYNAILALHLADALAVGVRIEAIDALRAGREELLDDEERIIAAYTRAVIAGDSTDEHFGQAVALFGERGAVEFTIFVAFLLATFRLWQSLGVPDVTDAQVDEMIEGFRAGRSTLPDPMRRIG